MEVIPFFLGGVRDGNGSPYRSPFPDATQLECILGGAVIQQSKQEVLNVTD